jgi:glycosyltransferase involved in cell wall biosynthesis
MKQISNDIRILFAVFQTGTQANGGVESVTQIIERLPAKRTVVSQRMTSINNRWLLSGAEVITLGAGSDQAVFALGTLGRMRFLLQLLRILWCNGIIARLLIRRRIDVIHCNDPTPLPYVALAAKLLRVPIVLNLRDTKSDDEGIDRRKYQRRFQLVDCVLLLSKEMETFYREITLTTVNRSPRFQYIYSVVDPDVFFPRDASDRSRMRRELGMISGQLAVGMLAAFCDKKNQLGFIRALATCAGASPNSFADIAFYFLGDCDERQSEYARQCLAELKDHPLAKNIHVRGFDRHPERWYAVLDVVVVPTRKEGLARSMIEAVVSGTPVVSFDVCSAHEILTGFDCGLVVTQGDYPAMFDAILQIKNSPTTALRLSRNAELVARPHFDPVGNVKKHMEMYRAVARRRLGR